MIPLSRLGRQLEQACKAKPRVIAFPETLDHRVIHGIGHLLSANAVAGILVWGDRSEFLQAAHEIGVPISGDDHRLRWCVEAEPDIEHRTLQHLGKRCQELGKKPDPKTLAVWSREPLHQAAFLLHSGTCAAVLAGAVATTAQVIRAGLFSIGCAEGVRTVSGAFLMSRDHGDQTVNMVFADCGVVVEPTEEQLVDIAYESWRLRSAFSGFLPDPAALAFLSFSTKGSAQHPRAETVRHAAERFRRLYPHILADGELQFDAAFIPEIGRRKAPGSSVAGRANVFVFPDLNAGNIAYKMTERLAGFSAYGPILQGFAKPLSDLSRGASAADIVVCTYINLLRA